MKRLFRISFVVCLLLVVVASIGLAANVKRFTIGTAGTSGALYPMGVTMAETINRNTDSFVVNAAASGASHENLRNLELDRIQWGISQNEMAYFKYYGIAEYEGKPDTKIRALFSTLSSWVQIFTTADSEIVSVEDFKGKKIGVGAPGSGGESTSRRVLKSYGLTYDDIRPEYISDTEMVAALRDGTIDAFIITHPLGSAALLDLTTSSNVKMLSIDSNLFFEENPYYSRQEIPANTYNNVDQAVTTAVSAVVMYTTSSADFTDDEIYSLLEAIWENRDEWKDTHAAIEREVTLKSVLDGVSTPLHLGAVKYFQDKGFVVPENLIPEN